MYKYSYPISYEGQNPVTYTDLGYVSPAHTGQFSHAVDFVVPDPRVTQSAIFAPQSGVVTHLVQVHTEWGSTKDRLHTLNYVTVRVGQYEFYEICHIAAGSCPFKQGDAIRRGDFLALTGLNGWITGSKESPDSHVHMLVGRYLPKGKFTSLRIRFER